MSAAPHEAPESSQVFRHLVDEAGAGAVARTCNTPMPNKIVIQSLETPQSLNRNGSNCRRSPATTAPQRLKAPAISTTASKVIESWTGKSIE